MKDIAIQLKRKKELRLGKSWFLEDFNEARGELSIEDTIDGYWLNMIAGLSQLLNKYKVNVFEIEHEIKDDKIETTSIIKIVRK